MDLRRHSVPILVGWTALLWLSRVRNVLADDDLSGAGRTSRIAVAVVFVAGAGTAGWAWRRRAVDPDVAWWTGRLLCAWTVVFWTGRGTAILLDDHDAAFLAVHAVLMTVSVGLSLWAWPPSRQSVRSAGRVA